MTDEGEGQGAEDASATVPNDTQAGAEETPMRPLDLLHVR